MGGAWACARGATWGRVGVRHAAAVERGIRLQWSEACSCAGAQRGAPPVRCVGQHRAQRELCKGCSMWLHRGAAWDRTGALCQAVQGLGMRLQRGVAWGWARAQPRRKGRNVGLCVGGAWGCARGAAWGRVGVRHAAELEQSTRLRRCAAWGSTGRSVKLRKGRSMVPHKGRGMRLRWSDACNWAEA